MVSVQIDDFQLYDH